MQRPLVAQRDAGLDIVSKSFLKAIRDLDEAGARMNTVFSETREVQARHDTALRRMMDLLTRYGDALDAEAPARLKSQNRQYSIQRRALQRQVKAINAAQQLYTATRAGFEDLFRSQNTVLADRAAADYRQQKREAALARVLEALIQDRCAAQVQSGNARGFDPPVTSHDYIPLKIDLLFNILILLDLLLALDDDFADAAQRYRPVSFLEIGCGHGRVAFLVRETGLLNCATVEGFDFNPDLVALGRDALNLGDTISVGDAMATDYGAHDIIYSFRPFSDNDLQVALETRIAAQMKPGAYLLAPSAQDLDRQHVLTRMSDDLPIWKKTADNGPFRAEKA